MPTDTATSPATRVCRILYYGPPGCGKRENLAQIQASLPAEHRLAVATSDPSRQIAFLLRNGHQGDWQVFVQAVDAGQEQALGSGAEIPFDGIVFVCGSSGEGLDAALSAMEGLKTFLDTWRLDLMSLPMVLQYNGRDAAAILPVDRLESLLNPWGLLSFPAVSSRGEGVRETLKAALSQTLSQILQRRAEPQDEPQPDLTVDPNPPVPGTPHTPGWEQPQAAVAPPGSTGAGDAALVIPVRVPRSALGRDGTGRIILEVRVVDD